MSKEVDERVVEMRFDNAQFEKNTRQTMKTLDELNRKLQLEGAEKGFEKISDASAKVDFDEMQGAVETLGDKFSALEVMGVAALVKITNQAIDTGEKLVKSLSIDQVTSGWSKYAEKTASVQTIMNATGKSITKVNSYLDKLMWYSDETSYGFTDMTASLGQLTAAGGDIDKLVPMIMGIANATAYAGKGASEFSRVIYNLNQSYSQGYLNLMDWKSVELAGVATAELKQLFIDTAVEQGKLKKGAVDVGTFGSTLSKKWADKEVMEATFGKLAEFTTAVKELQESDPKKYSTAAKAIEALEGQYDEVTVKAFKAAQEAKSFTEAVDATKDAVSSGWMETFDILFGNYEEAKGFWSDLADEFWDIFAGGQDARNNWLKSAFDSGLDQLLGTEGFSDATDNFTNLLQKSLTKTGLISAEDIEAAGSFQKALEESGVTAQQLYAVLQDAGDGYARMAQMSDKELKKEGLNRDTLKKLAQSYSSMAEKIKDGSVNLDDFAGKMNQLSGREHFFNGILNILEGINSALEPMREAFDEVFMTDGSPLYNLLKGFDELTGKFRLSENTAKKMQKVFKGVFSVLNIGFKAVSVVVKTVIAAASKLMDLLSPVTDLLMNIGSGIGNVLSWVDQSLGQAESLTDVLEILLGAVIALLSPIRELWNGFRSLVRGGDIEEAKSQFGAFGTVVNAIGGVLDKFKMGSVSASGIISKAVIVLGGVFMMAFDGIGALIGNAFNGFKDAGQKVEDFKEDHVPMLENIRDTVLSIPEKAEETLKDFGGTMSSILGTISSAIRNAMGAIKDFFNLQDGVDLYRLLALIDVGALAGAIWAIYKGLTGVSKTLKKISDDVRSDLKNPVTKLLESMKSAVDSWTKQHTTNNFVNIAKGISIAIGAISASMYLLSKIEDPMKAAQALGSVIAMLFGLVVAMKALAKTDVTGLDSAKIFASITSFAIGLLALTAMIKGIAKAMASFKEFSTDEMNNAVGAIMSIMFVMTAMIGLIEVFNYMTNKLQASSKIKMGSALKGMSAYIAAATALVEVCGALYLIAELDEKKLQDAYGAILVLGLTMTGMVAAIAGLNILNNQLKATSKNKLSGITEGVSAFLVVAASLAVIAGSAYLFSKVANLDSVMWAILGTLVVMGTVIGVVSKFDGEAAKMKAGAESMLIASASMIVIAEALNRMNEAMRADGSGAGFAGMATALIILAGVVYFLGNNATESIGAAAALVAMGFALIELAQAIKIVSDLSVSDIAKGVIAFGLSLLALVGAAAWLPAASASILQVAGACLMLATALLILTPAFKGLASLSLGEVVAGVAGMAGILVGLFAIGANPAIAVGFGALSVSLISLAKAFSVFAGGLIKLSVAVGILELISLFAGPIKEVIVGAADDIRVALDTIVTTICNVLNDCAEPISEALTTLCKILIQSFVDLVAWAWEGEGGEGDGIKGALDQLWANIMAWIEEKAHLDSKSSIFDLSSWIDTFTADDRPIGKIMNKVFGEDISEAGKGLIEQINGTGEDIGKNLSQGAANGISETADTANSAGADMAQTTVDATAEAAGVQSPSWKTFEIGSYMAQGLANGLSAQTSIDAVTSAATALSTAAETNFRNYWGIHSPSTLMEFLSKFIPEGFKEGLTGTEGTASISSGIVSMKDKALEWMDSTFPSLVNKAKDYGNQITNALTQNKYEGMPGFDEWYKNELSAYTKNGLKGNGSGLTDEDLKEEAKKEDDGKNNGKNNGSSGSGKKSGKKSSTKQKTVAEQIEEKYKTRLEANKTLREILDNEYELWTEENQNSADIDTQMAKKAENAAAEIANQTDRVAIAQAKYDEMAKRWGKDKQETKEAYNDLLEEKASLAKLKADQYTNLFEAATTRYDANLDTLEKEYNLWSTQNDKTATKMDKLDRETQYQNEELAIKQKKLDNAQKQYDTLREKYGEEDLRTIEAHNDLLDAQTEALEIQNDLAQKELDKLDILIENIQNAQSQMQSRMDILSTVYDDGSLKEREDAYKQAVEEYGKDSEQARKAQFQGTTSAILSTVTALKNLNYQMQQTKKYEEELAAMTPGTEEYESKQSDILSSKSSFVSFASNLADALNMEDSGKRAMLIFANSFQDHYEVFENAFAKVMDKVKGSMSDEMQQTFSDIFGVMSRDEYAQMSTEFISAVNSALQGDWAGALASGLAFALDFAFTDTGKDIQGWFRDTVFPAIQKCFAEIGTMFGGEGGFVSIFQNGAQQIAAAFNGGGGVTGAIAAIGPMLTNVGAALTSFLAEFWWVFLIVGAIAALIGGIAWYVSSRKKASNSTNIGEEFDKEFSSGIEDDADKVTDAAKDLTEDAVEIAKGALSTISKVMDDDYEYTPQITPVVDLTEVTGSAEELNSAFDATAKAMSLDDGVTKKMAAQIEAQAEIQNGLKATANNDTLNAINALGEHMDGVAESIKGMKMTINGRKTIGYIDSQLGARAR